ncbi:MAG: SRPBCC domain-containing protein [Parasphingorhabdus sp.]
MAEVIIEKHYKTDPETLFAYLTEEQHMANWWGPEGTTVQTEHLAFGSSGSWMVIMLGDDSGARHKVTGEILEYDPPHAVRFTWAWHDDDDVRGHESEVAYIIEREGEGVKFTLRHTGLEDEESAINHNGGWSSSLGKLDNVFI